MAISSRASRVLAGPPLCHSRAAAGSATGRPVNGRDTTTAAPTKQLPRVSFWLPAGTFSDPSYPQCAFLTGASAALPSSRVTRQPPMLPHIPGKIIPTRRIEHTYPKNAKVE